MSVDRDPQVGDEFTFGEHDGTHYEVHGVTSRNVFYETVWLGEPCFCSIGAWRDSATLVVPRPKVSDCWGCLTDGRFISMSGEDCAREHLMFHSRPGHNLARIVNGRVCDEHGVPYEVEP